MVQESERAGFVDPALVRLLARLGGAVGGDAGQAPADRLGQWLAWTDAIALSTILDRDAPPPRGRDGGETAGECGQVRRDLAAAIAGDDLFSGSPRRETGQGARKPAEPPAPDYETYRERYVFLQRAMSSRITASRARLRAALAARGGGMARLAAVDAVMEPVTGARERNLLEAIPAMLEKRFVRLRQAAGEAGAGPASWLETFRQDARSVLQAELDVRMLPLEGLAQAMDGR